MIIVQEPLLTLNAAEQSMLESVATMLNGPVAPMVPAWDAERRHCLDALQIAAGIGLTGLQVPTGMGGQGLSFQCKVAVAELLAQSDFGLSMALINTQNVATKLCTDAPASLAQLYVPGLLNATRVGCTALTEPHAGSDFAAITTQATRQSDGWRINGRKAWITNATAADVIVLYAQTEPGSGGRGIAGFLIDGRRQGFVREAAHAMIGQHSIGAGGFGFQDYLATDQEMILAPGEAFKSALTSINGARIYVAAMCCGMLASALHAVRRYGSQRQTFGVSLHGHQGWRWILAEADAELMAARALVAHASLLLDQGVDTRQVAAKAKVFATRMAERHLSALMQAMGAEGLLQNHPIGRHLSGLQMAGLVDGSTQMLLERIAVDLAKSQ